MAKKKESEGVDIFGSAKPKAKSSAKSDKTVVEVKGLEKKLLEHQWLSGEQANLKTQIDIIKDELKQIGLEKYVELYKDNKSNPNTFLIQDGEGCVMFMPTDKYITIDEARADELIERYGEDAVTVDEKFSFDSKYLERNLEAIKKLLRETKTISDEDKKNLLVKEVKYSVSKGTIDKLYQYGSKMASVLDDIQPVIALKNCGGKMEKGGNMDDLIGYVYEGSEDADEKIIKKVDLYAKGSTISSSIKKGDFISVNKGISGFKDSPYYSNKKFEVVNVEKHPSDKGRFIVEYINSKGNIEKNHIDNVDKVEAYAKGSTVPRFSGYSKHRVEGGDMDLSLRDKMSMYAWIDNFLEKYSGDDNRSQSLDMYKEFAKKFKKNEEQTHDIIDSGWARSRGYDKRENGGGVGKHKTEEEIYEEEQHNAMFNSEYGNGGNMSSGYDYSIGGL